MSDSANEHDGHTAPCESGLDAQVLQLVLDSMADGVIVADQQGHFLLWNPAAEQLIGIGPRDVHPTQWNQLYGCYLPDCRTLCPAEDLPLTRAMRGESVDGMVLFVRNPSLTGGVWLSMNARPLKSDRGERCGGVVVLRDITAERQAEEELRESERKYRAILDTAQEAFVASDAASRICQWNARAEATFGWTRQQAIGRLLTETIIPQRYREAHRQGMQRFLATGEGPILNRRLELVALHRDGHEFPVEMTIAVVQRNDSILFGAFIHDITEQKRHRQEMRQAWKTAEAASRAKSDFLANMSHEIRTPMNAIIGMTALLLDTSLTPTQREYLAMVLESGESLLAVINDILDFSKIEAGRFDLESAPFDLRENVGDTVKSLALRAHRKGLELACHIHRNVPDFVVGDRHRLRQILVNLVGNAIKFTDSGEIVVQVQTLSQSAEEIVMQFSVRDTGTGIPLEKQQQIFEAFEQVDESITRRHGGTGLGLTISSHLVELMGGKLQVDSQPGQGSTFHFTVRLGLPRDGLPRPQRGRCEQLEGLHVLVVDDNATNCLILEEMLRSWRMQPETLTDSSQAVALMRARHREGNAFSLLLVDANMPKIDGFDVVEAVKDDPDLGSSITMMLTSSSWRDEVTRCQQLGVAAYLTKPIKQSELYDVIAATMGIEPPAADEKPNPHVPTPATRPLRILLAEDSVVNQRLALAQLQPDGHQVVLASNGSEAITKWETDSFDLILMDVQMPELDGLAATEYIRQRERELGRHVPIVAMTAYAMKGDRERCLAAGMDAYVSKPVRKQELLAAIAEVMSRPAYLSPQPVHPAALATASLSDQPEDHPHPVDEESRVEPPLDIDVLDWEAALAQTEVGPEVLQEMIELFLQQSPLLLKQIREALATGDARNLRRAAHTLKGSAAVFAARRATQAALHLETLAKEQRLSDAPAACNQLETELSSLRQALNLRASQPGDAGS